MPTQKFISGMICAPVDPDKNRLFIENDNISTFNNNTYKISICGQDSFVSTAIANLWISQT